MKRLIQGQALKLDIAPGFLSQHISRILGRSDSRDAQGDQIKLHKGDIIIGGRNFGHSDETIPETLQSAGTSCIIAVSFVRPFYRNCINLGLPLIENSEAFDKIASGETVSIDFDRGEILCRKGILSFPQYPEAISKILFSGGLIPHIKRTLEK